MRNDITETERASDAASGAWAASPHGTSGRAVLRLARQDTSLASVRYRGLLPACALNDLGWRTTLTSRGRSCEPHDARIAIAVKPLAQADADWTRGMRDAGMPVIVDLCDNIFVEGYAVDGPAIAERFALTVEGCTVTVPTPALGDVVAANTAVRREDILLVPDIVETPALLRQQRRVVGERRPIAGELAQRMAMIARRMRRGTGPRRKMIWFGNHGGHSRFGLDDLLLFAPALQDAARLGAELWVVSNHRERYEALRRTLPIRSSYVEWSHSRLESLLASSDVCLIPNSGDAFSRTKSANRALKALAAGVPVVATGTDAYAGLSDAVWLGSPSEGVRTYLQDSATRDMHLRAARAAIERDHSMPSLRRAMDCALHHAGAL